jgi:hypothetical protein
MNAKKQRALELRNKARMDERSLNPPMDRVSALRLEVATLKRNLELALDTVQTQKMSIDSLLGERSMQARMWADLGERLQEYGLSAQIVYGRVVVSAFNWAAWDEYQQRQRTAGSPAKQDTINVVKSRERQIVLDEDA